jgi:HSP20 family protein
LSEKDAKVEATEDGLVIEGERTQEKSEAQGGVRRSERSYGRFYCLIPFPEGAKIDEAKATFNNEVVEVTIPVPESQKRQQIPTSTGQRAKAQHP